MQVKLSLEEIQAELGALYLKNRVLEKQNENLRMQNATLIRRADELQTKYESVEASNGH